MECMYTPIVCPSVKCKHRFLKFTIIILLICHSPLDSMTKNSLNFFMFREYINYFLSANEKVKLFLFWSETNTVDSFFYAST